MRVVHVYDGHERVGGGEGSVPSVVWNLARRTAARGHDVTVVEREWQGTDASERRDGVSFVRIGLRTGADDTWTDVPREMVQGPVGALRLVADRANFARATHRYLRRTAFDVLHVHLPFAANLLTVDPRLARRTVYTAHVGETRRRIVDPLVSLDALLARRAARTVALNPGMARAFVERGVPEDRVATIPNGVDRARFDGVTAADRRRVRDRYGLAGDVVLFVGTVTPRKGVDDLAAAAGRFLPGRDATLVVVGADDLDPAYAESVRAQVADAGVDDDVVFAGFVPEDDLLALYAAADVFALPSYEEGSSIAVAEAVAAGLPVVATRIDGVVQQIDHGTHGLLVESGDSEALAAAVERLLDDPERRDTMAEALDDRADARSWERTTERVLDLYEEVS